jgi:hypothetical protein
VDELLPIIVVGLGALLFSKQSSAQVNPYASIPSGAMTLGSTGMPLINSNAGLYSAQPYLIASQGYPNQSYYNPAYQQLQAQNGMVNLASGVINKLPDNIGSTIASKVGSVATGQAASAAADAVLSNTASQAASDAAAQAAVESAIAADTAASIGADAAASSIAADAVATDAVSTGILDSIGSFIADWGWAAW